MNKKTLIWPATRKCANILKEESQFLPNCLYYSYYIKKY